MNDEIKEKVDMIIKKVRVAMIKHREGFYDYDMLVCHELDYNEWKNLLDYITKLQEDIRTGQEINSELQQENERLKEIWKDTIVFSKDYETIVMNTNGYKFYNDYKSRCEKAIEYINCNKQKTICAYGDNEDDDFEICLWEEDIDNLLNILQNGSDSQ